jgi:hypothetical protein
MAGIKLAMTTLKDILRISNVVMAALAPNRDQ